ncbi:MAG: sigma-70 family RNA polymerase sigma factor [Bacillota bacterium]
MERADLLAPASKANEKWTEFEELVLAHQRAFYHFALRLTGSEEEAEDLLQESLLRAFRSFNRFTPGTAFDRWVYRIIYHLFVDGYRHRRRSPISLTSLDEPIQSEENEMIREVPDARDDPEEAALTGEFYEELKRALSALPPEFRTAVALCDVQGLSYEEIAQIMNCSIGTVRSRIHRGRRQLRERLAPYLAGARKEVGRTG